MLSLFKSIILTITVIHLTMINQQNNINHNYTHTILLSIPSVFYFTLINNNRDLLQTGLLDVIIQKEHQTDTETLILNVGHFPISINNDWKIIRCQYQDTVSYYFIDSFDNLTALILEKRNPDKLNFEGYLKGFVTILQTNEVLQDVRLKSILDTHWEHYESKAPVTADGFQKFISSAGHIVGSGIFKMGNKFNHYWNKNKAAPEVRQEPGWFGRLKAKTGKLFGRTSQTIKPVVQPICKKGKEVNQKIRDSIDQGDSQILKYIKDVASISSEAIKNIYLGAKAAAKGKDTFYSQSNAPKDYRVSSPLKPRNQNLQDSQQDSKLDLLDREGIKDQLLDK